MIQPFVVLEHELPDGSIHFDFMFSVPDREALETFACPADPLVLDGPAAQVVRLGPHRRDYLTYEGAVSGNRGVVRRVGEGAVDAITMTEQEITLSLQTATGRHDFLLQTRGDHSDRGEIWVLSRLV
jgi:hypothetical protein